MSDKESSSETKGATPATETSNGAPGEYQRGENQKDVTKSYRQNWNQIFGKKRPRRRASGRGEGRPPTKH